MVAVPSGSFFDALLVRIGGEGDGGGDTDCGDDTGGDNGGDGTDGDGTDGGGTDGDGTDGDGDNTHDGEPEGSHRVAQAIADTFGVPVAEVLALHENGAGFGAIFKLYWLAAAGDTTVEALMADADGNGGFAFGKLFKEMDDEVSAFSAQHDDMPKNLGQAVSGGEKKDMDSLETDEADGHGPPDHAKAHGRR